MEITRQLFNAKIDAHVGYEYMGGDLEENIGESQFGFHMRDLRRVFQRFPKTAEEPDMLEVLSEHMVDNYDDDDDIDVIDDSDMIMFRNTDCALKILRLLGDIGGEVNIEWYGENRTWFFHDMLHAENDCTINYGECRIYVDDGIEERRIVDGARDALKAGLPIGEVCAMLASVPRHFKDRFRREMSDPWDKVFGNATISFDK